MYLWEVLCLVVTAIKTQYINQLNYETNNWIAVSRGVKSKFK